MFGSRKTTIGIMGKIDYKFGNLTCNYPYMSFFRQFGSVILIDPLIDSIDLYKDINLLVLPGGEDVFPMRYNRRPDERTNQPNIFSEWFDTQVVPQFIKHGTPIFGICRGFQTLNVIFGGTLNQHIDTVTSEKSRTELVHGLEETGQDIPFKYNMEKVNSLHHQGIHNEDLATSMIPLLRCTGTKKQNNIEAIMHVDERIIGVQWHPEEIWDDFSVKAVEFLLKGKK